MALGHQDLSLSDVGVGGEETVFLFDPVLCLGPHCMSCQAYVLYEG